jgi:hypothetical protein
LLLAPSWSWASINAPVRYPYWDECLETAFVADILDVNTPLIGADSTGAVSGGYLTVSGHLRSSARKVSRSLDYVIDPKARNTIMRHMIQDQEWFDVGYTSNGEMPIEDAYFLLLAQECWKRASGIHYYGIILEAVSHDASKYRRIGCFHHRRTEKDGCFIANEHYPDFNDFDPNNYERRTVTIV